MTKYKPIDYYNAWMNDEVASTSHGAWVTPEDMQIATICAIIATFGYVDDGDHATINVEELQELVEALETQSNQLKQ